MVSFTWPDDGSGGGGGGVDTVGLIDSQTPSSNGLVISGSTIYAQSASDTAPGLVNNDTQTLSGQKTFSTGLTGTLTGSASLNILTSARGNLTDAGTDGIVVTGGSNATIGNVSLAQHVADSTHNGYLSSTDWSTFNGKQASGNYITALTGDATASGPGSAALTLAIVNSNVGTFGAASQVAVFTVNAKGLVTAAASTSILIAESQVTNLVSDLAGKQAIGNYITALTGDVTASGPGSVAASLVATTNATLATISTLVSVGTITTGTWSATTIALNKGGTGQTTKAAAFDALSPMSAGGDLIYGGTSGTGTRLANGSAGQTLNSAGGTSAPTWGFPTYRSVTTTDSPTNSDTTLDCNGASFTITLPTAVGFAGKVFRIIHSGTSQTQVYTLATTSAQTIGGVASGSYALYSNGESLTIQSNGANWIILDHLTSSVPTAYTPTFTGYGTVTAINVVSWRQGAFLYIDGTFTSGSTTAVEARISLGFAGVDGNATTVSTLPTLSCAGRLEGGTTTATWFGGNVVLIEASKAYFTLGIESNGFTTPMGKRNGSSLTNTALYSFNGKFQITGWQP